MKKKVLLFLAVTLLSVVLLSGCTKVPDGSDGGTPRLEGILIANEIYDNKEKSDKIIPLDEVDKDTPELYGCAELYNAYKKMQVRYKWTYYPEGKKEVDMGTITVEIPEERTVWLYSKIDNSKKILKSGKYKFSVSLPQEKDKATLVKEFIVK